MNYKRLSLFVLKSIIHTYVSNDVDIIKFDDNPSDKNNFTFKYPILSLTFRLFNLP